jgi:hypothetical protein
MGDPFFPKKKTRVTAGLCIAMAPRGCAQLAIQVPLLPAECFGSRVKSLWKRYFYSDPKGANYVITRQSVNRPVEPGDGL